MSRLVSERRRGDALCIVAEALLERDHMDEARIALHEARAQGADEGIVRLQLAESALRLGDLPQARAELTAVPEDSAPYARACAARVVLEVVDGDLEAASDAVAELERVTGDSAAPAAYRRVIAAHGGAPVTAAVAEADREQVLAVLFLTAGSLLALGRLDAFNLTVPLLYEVAAGAGEVDERLGHLLLKEGFIDPPADGSSPPCRRATRAPTPTRRWPVSRPSATCRRTPRSSTPRPSHATTRTSPATSTSPG